MTSSALSWCIVARETLIEGGNSTNLFQEFQDILKEHGHRQVLH
jgi:hypothetical protein